MLEYEDLTWRSEGPGIEGRLRSGLGFDFESFQPKKLACFMDSGRRHKSSESEMQNSVTPGAY